MLLREFNVQNLFFFPWQAGRQQKAEQSWDCWGLVILNCIAFPSVYFKLYKLCQGVRVSIFLFL